jgi:hypothetical protein
MAQTDEIGGAEGVSEKSETGFLSKDIVKRFLKWLTAIVFESRAFRNNSTL